MKTSSRKSADEEMVLEIERRFQQLKSPRSYLAGRRFADVAMPQNILVFSRTGGRSLLMGSDFRQQHHRYVLITALRSGGTIGVDTRTFPIREGQSLLIFPFQTHWYVNLVQPEIRWIFVTFEHEKDTRLEVLRDRGAVQDEARGMEHVRDFLRAWQGPEEQDVVRLRLATWLHLLAVQANRKHLPSDMKSSPSGDGEWVAEINRFVFERREQTLLLSEIAGHLNISASVLRSRFRDITGRPVGRYIRALKLQYACELLHDTSCSIGEVAERCGYDSIFSFSRSFHQAYGLRPSAYRSQHKLRSDTFDDR